METLNFNRKLKKLSKMMEFNFFLRLLWVVGFPMSTNDCVREPESEGRVERKRVKVDCVSDGGEGVMGESCETGEICEGDEEEEEDMHTMDDRASKPDWKLLVTKIQASETGDPEVSSDREGGRVQEGVLKVLAGCLKLLHLHTVYHVSYIPIHTALWHIHTPYILVGYL